jgi:hypothetical protein
LPLAVVVVNRLSFFIKTKKIKERKGFDDTWWTYNHRGMRTPSEDPCPDHNKLFIWFQLWNYWGLCSKIDVGPPLFTTGDADAWCQKWPVWSAPRCSCPPITTNFPSSSNRGIVGACVHKMLLLAHHFLTLLQPEMATGGVKIGRCDQPQVGECARDTYRIGE